MSQGSSNYTRDREHNRNGNEQPDSSTTSTHKQR